ncbi:MAG: hypothetical protein Q9225_003012 [Loekoesia sp. 1 TL-2023]
MAPVSGRPIREVLRELVAALKFRKKLEKSPEQQPLFDPGWIDNIIRVKFEELELSNISTSLAEGLENLARMVNAHRDLVERNLINLVNQLTAAIVYQKSCIGYDGSGAEGVSSSKTPKEPLMSGAIPTSVDQTFAMKACGTDEVKFSAVD